jgi:hypothetical protein
LQEKLPAAKETARHEGRPYIGRDTLQTGSFPTILHQKITAGVSLAVIFYFVLCEDLSLWSASQF